MRKAFIAVVIGGFAASAILATEGLTATVGPMLAVKHAGDGLIENVQAFVWDGQRYCWYDDGWEGPGFYWCGYAWRSGYGWGGPSGFHGWHHKGKTINKRRGRSATGIAKTPNRSKIRSSRGAGSRGPKGNKPKR